jgi:hypothetical protein
MLGADGDSNPRSLNFAGTRLGSLRLLPTSRGPGFVLRAVDSNARQSQADPGAEGLSVGEYDLLDTPNRVTVLDR